MKAFKFVLLAVAIWFFAVINAGADMNQVKVYKEAFPEEKPKCNYCHIDALPKKDPGKHDLNEYGLKAKGTLESPTVETYKSLGSAATLNQDAALDK